MRVKKEVSNDYIQWENGNILQVKMDGGRELRNHKRESMNSQKPVEGIRIHSLQ